MLRKQVNYLVRGLGDVTVGSVFSDLNPFTLGASLGMQAGEAIETSPTVQNYLNPLSNDPSFLSLLNPVALGAQVGYQTDQTLGQDSASAINSLINSSVGIPSNISSSSGLVIAVGIGVAGLLVLQWVLKKV